MEYAKVKGLNREISRIGLGTWSHRISWRRPAQTGSKISAAPLCAISESRRAARPLAQENYGKRVLDLAVRWTLDQPFVTVALSGARHPGQLEAVAKVGGWKLDGAALKVIGDIVAESVTDPVGPEFMAPPPRSEQKQREDMRRTA